MIALLLYLLHEIGPIGVPVGEQFFELIKPRVKLQDVIVVLVWILNILEVNWFEFIEAIRGRLVLGVFLKLRLELLDLLLQAL